MGALEQLREEFWELKIHVLGPREENDFVPFSVAGFNNSGDYATYLLQRRAQFQNDLRQEFIQKGDKPARLLFQLEVIQCLSDLLGLYYETQGEFLNMMVHRKNIQYLLVSPELEYHPYLGLPPIFMQQRDFLKSLSEYVNGLGPWIESLQENKKPQSKNKPGEHWIKYESTNEEALRTLHKLLKSHLLNPDVRFAEFRKIFSGEKVTLTWQGTTTELVVLFKTLLIDKHKILKAKNPFVHLRNTFVLKDGSPPSADMRTYDKLSEETENRLEEIAEKVLREHNKALKKKAHEDQSQPTEIK